MQQLSESLWTVDGERVRLLSIPFDTRMTVARLDGGGLWLHSPVAVSDERLAAVEALGTVEHIVAPNRFHNLFVAPWAKRFPEARCWAGPGVIERCPQLRFDEQLGDEAPPAWRGHIDQLIFGGSAVLPEAVFCHRPSRTLILTDIIQNHDPARESWLWRKIKGLNGILAPEGGCPKDWRLTVRDRDGARRARDRMLSWDFERVVISHGLCIDRDGHAFIERAFGWLDGLS